MLQRMEDTGYDDIRPLDMIADDITSLPKSDDHVSTAKLVLRRTLGKGFECPERIVQHISSA